jgi:hypothetical protein
MGSFQLRVRRSVDAAEAAAAPVAAAPVAVHVPAAAPVPAPVPYMSLDVTPDESVDEAMVYVTAPKVMNAALSCMSSH